MFIVLFLEEGILILPQPQFETTIYITCRCLRLCVCVCVRSTHLHVGSPQGHAVGGQPQNNDNDVKCGLEELVHLTVHITERDVAHCPVWSTLGVFVRVRACDVCSAALSSECPSAVSLSSSSSSLTATCQLWVPARRPHGCPTWSSSTKQNCHVRGISWFLFKTLSLSPRGLDVS